MPFIQSGRQKIVKPKIWFNQDRTPAAAVLSQTSMKTDKKLPWLAA